MPQTPVERFESHFFQCLKNCVARKNLYQKGVLIGKIPKEERINAIRRVARQFSDFVENPNVGDYMTQAFADATETYARNAMGSSSQEENGLLMEKREGGKRRKTRRRRGRKSRKGKSTRRR